MLPLASVAAFSVLTLVLMGDNGVPMVVTASRVAVLATMLVGTPLLVMAQADCTVNEFESPTLARPKLVDPPVLRKFTFIPEVLTLKFPVMPLNVSDCVPPTPKTRFTVWLAVPTTRLEKGPLFVM